MFLEPVFTEQQLDKDWLEQYGMSVDCGANDGSTKVIVTWSYRMFARGANEHSVEYRISNGKNCVSFVDILHIGLL